MDILVATTDKFPLSCSERKNARTLFDCIESISWGIRFVARNRVSGGTRKLVKEFLSLLDSTVEAEANELLSPVGL